MPLENAAAIIVFVDLLYSSVADVKVGPRFPPQANAAVLVPSAPAKS